MSETQNGSTAAFSELMHRYQKKLLRFLLSRCVSSGDAEDALQDTFMNAWRYSESYNPKWRFSTWIYRIAIRNAARQVGRPEAVDDSMRTTSNPLEECIAHSERQNLWLTARAALAPDAYAALWLRYVEDMRIKDIANALDRSQSWTKVTLMRSRRRLESEMRCASSTQARGELYG